MKNLNPKVKEYLESLEQDKNFLISHDAELRISNKIESIIKKDESYKATKYDCAEQVAFAYFIRSPDSEYSWGANYHYGPSLVYGGKEYPCIQWVDKEVLAYWSERAKRSKNPILSSRYADLVVDFSQEVIKEKANSDMFQIVIDGNIAIFEKSLTNIKECKIKINRALNLAKQINDENRIRQAENAMERLEQDIKESIKKDYPS